MNNLIAHRGLKINAQENTLKAFQNALNNPHYAGFECDIRTSKDGVFVICHNPLIKEDIISLTNYKDLKAKDLYAVCLDAAITTAMIFLIIGSAVVFAHFLTSERIPHTIAAFLIEQEMSWWMFLIIVNIILFIMGQFMEPSSVVMIMTPLLLPIAVSLGIDPIHFGIIMVVNMELGMITPPVGLNLFVASSLTGLGLKDVVVSVLPWLVVMLIGLVLITYIPQLSLVLT